jgi:putative restriction endonuclease
MDREELIRRIHNLKMWQRGDQRAPHKPLLLLYALGRCLRGQDRLIPYADVDRDLRKLLSDFGPPRQSLHPENPFCRLQTDGIWELWGAENLQGEVEAKDIPKTKLLRHNVHGGFTQDIYRSLISDRQLVTELVTKILEANFPATYHEDLLQAVGIELVDKAAEVKPRDPYFRNKVLLAYEYQCAVCGFNVRLGDSLIALEAAHIKWHQAGGPDLENNGIALCSMHHKLFDRGAFTITDTMVMKVSEIAHGTVGFKEWLMAFHGCEITPPQRPTYYPESSFVRWHFKEVFKGSSRYG